MADLSVSIGSRIAYYMQVGSEPKVEITREAYLHAGTTSGMIVGGLINYSIGDISYSFAHVFDPMSEEEYAEAKARWENRDKNAPPKLLLEWGEQIPDGYSGPIAWSPRPLDYAGPVIGGIDWYQKISGLKDAEIKFDGVFNSAPGEYRYPNGILAAKYSMVTEVPLELLKDSVFDIVGFLSGNPKPVTRRVRIRSAVNIRRFRLAEWLYRKITGQYIEEDWNRNEDW